MAEPRTEKLFATIAPDGGYGSFGPTETAAVVALLMQKGSAGSQFENGLQWSEHYQPRGWTVRPVTVTPGH